MARYKVILAYDGTNFHGFQRQENGRTVQASFETALRNIGWQDAAISAAGRTDSGVHASGQVVSFEFDWQHSHEAMRDALNANLPPDVAAQAVADAEDDFHPRHSAKARRYCYKLFCSRTRQPLRERYAWRIWPEVSLDKLNDAARWLIGTHDYSAFGSPHQPGGSTIRQVIKAGWMKDGSDYVFEILGNAFLYHMVRRLVSWQVEIGQGKRDLADLAGLLDGEHNKLVQGLAPARGLVLSEVLYQLDS